MCHIWVKMWEKWKPEKVKLKSLRNAHWNREVKNEGTTQQLENLNKSQKNWKKNVANVRGLNQPTQILIWVVFSQNF